MTTSNSMSVKPVRFIIDYSFHQPEMSWASLANFSTAPVFLVY
jgi:hypothetical protein